MMVARGKLPGLNLVNPQNLSSLNPLHCAVGSVNV